MVGGGASCIEQGSSNAAVFISSWQVASTSLHHMEIWVLSYRLRNVESICRHFALATLEFSEMIQAGLGWRGCGSVSQSGGFRSSDLTQSVSCYQFPSQALWFRFIDLLSSGGFVCPPTRC